VQAPAPVRLLAPGDEPLLAAFFARHPDTTLFLQSNSAAAGLVDRGEPQQGSYAGAFDRDGALVAVACHCWNGNLLLEAPEALAAVAGAAVAASGRAVTGLIGRDAQARAARRVLGLEAAETTLDSREDLFALALAELRVPAPLAAGALACRPPRDEELAGLVAWRHDYRVEAIGEAPGPGLRARCAEEIELLQRLERQFVLEEQGRLVAYAAYNAATPDCVQIGGVWTPPALRGRGHARAVVAGALLRARERGVARSVLFTPTGNAPAQAAYRALGYRRTGDYALILFARPQPVHAG
jgi:ribosomal protein S18 acetylase RimI-like enzyme